jgi:membrane associated rhomboid family serine protease
MVLVHEFISSSVPEFISLGLNLRGMDKEVKRMIYSFLPGLVLVGALWVVKWIEVKSEVSLADYGVFPRTLSGLKGVITSLFIHGDLKHLVSNSIPLLVLAGGLFYFYNSLAYRVIIGTYLLGGFWLWLGGRESYHIGASGLVYGLTTFLFFSGMLRRDIKLMALSMLVVFLYGGMVWGIFPLFVGVSWEAHLFGAIAGILFAFVYRKEGPQRKVYEWEKEPEEEEADDENAYWKLPTPTPEVEIGGGGFAIGEGNNSNDDTGGVQQKAVNIRYIYRPKDSPATDSPDEKN